VTLLERLRARYPEASGRSLKQWLAGGRVEVNGRPCHDGRLAVGPGDTVALADRRPAAPFPRELTLIHEDDALLVIVKPAGLLTIATERERERTAYRLLTQHVGERIFIVHRLDRETSGLLVFAKSVAAKRHLQTQFEARQVERIYLAVVDGRVTDDEGTLESRLVEDRGLRVRSGARGRQAITHYRVRERRRDSTLLELRLGTGRRHQIRVQLAEQGHPIVGDTAHGGPGGRFGRVCLHATRLGFVHPKSGAPMRFERRAPGAWV